MPGGLLSAVLQGVNGEICQASDIQPRRADAKDTACFTGRVELIHICTSFNL